MASGSALSRTLTLTTRFAITFAPAWLLGILLLLDGMMVRPWMVAVFGVGAVAGLGALASQAVRTFLSPSGSVLLVLQLAGAGGVVGTAVATGTAADGTKAPSQEARDAIKTISDAHQQDNIGDGIDITRPAEMALLPAIRADCEDFAKFVPSLPGSHQVFGEKEDLHAHIWSIEGSQANDHKKLKEGRYVGFVSMPETASISGFPTGLSCVVVVKPPKEEPPKGNAVEAVRALIVPIRLEGGPAPASRLVRMSRCDGGAPRPLARWHEKNDDDDKCERVMPSTGAKPRDGEPTTCFSCANNGWCEM